MAKQWLTYATISGSLLTGLVCFADTKPAPDCPAVIRTAVDRAFPKSTVTKCKPEHEHGHDQFEVKLTKAGGMAIEVDVAPDGKILQIEETVPLAQVPAAVVKAFGAKYPNVKFQSAEKQTPAQGTPSYELAFTTERGRKEATFTEDGKFVGEE